VDTTNNVGQFSSIAIGTDGFPVISYYDGTNADLVVTQCGNAACSSGNTKTTVDSGGDVGWYSSITIGTDGYPVIAYFDTTNANLVVTKCGNAKCSSGNTTTAVDSGGDVGQYPSIAIGWDGYPIVSYYDSTNNALKVAKCGNAACSLGNVLTSLVATNGRYTSIAIGQDGMPIISYSDDSSVSVARCANRSCTSTASTTALVGGKESSITVRRDGIPVYISKNLTSLTVNVCSSAQCTASTSVGISGTASSGSIAIGVDGFPVVSYYDTSNADLIVEKCNDAACTDATNTTTTIDSTGDVGQHTSIDIGSDGNPVISYYQITSGDLKVARCATPACSEVSGSGSLVGVGSDIGSRSQFFRSIYSAQYWGKQYQIAEFADIAENYRTNDASISAGDIVAASSGTSIRKTAVAYDPAAIGVVSTKAGITLGKETGTIPVALAGRVPVKVMVTLRPGSGPPAGSSAMILPGDAIAPSNIPGLGMKAERAGYVVALSLEDTSDWSQERCGRAESIDAILWPQDDGTNKGRPCFRISGSPLRSSGSFTGPSAGSGEVLYVGKVLAFVRTSWNEPALQLVSDTPLEIASAVMSVLGAPTSESGSSVSGAPVGFTTSNLALQGAFRAMMQKNAADSPSIYSGSLLEQRIALLEGKMAAMSGAVRKGTEGTEATEGTNVLPSSLALFGSLKAGDIASKTLSVEDTLAVKDASVLGDLTVGGVFSVSDLYVPNGVRIDGGLHAATLNIETDATINGTLTLNSTLNLTHGVVFASGSILFAHDLVVRDALHVIGPITVDGLAQFFGDVQIKGQLTLSNRQAGFAEIPQTGTAVTVFFGSGGFIAQPVVTASPDVPVLYAVSRATQSGFTIRLGAPALEPITFSWAAMLTENPQTTREHSAAGGEEVHEIQEALMEAAMPASSSIAGSESLGSSSSSSSAMSESSASFSSVSSDVSASSSSAAESSDSSSSASSEFSSSPAPPVSSPIDEPATQASAASSSSTRVETTGSSSSSVSLESTSSASSESSAAPVETPVVP